MNKTPLHRLIFIVLLSLPLLASGIFDRKTLSIEYSTKRVAHTGITKYREREKTIASFLPAQSVITKDYACQIIWILVESPALSYSTVSRRLDSSGIVLSPERSLLHNLSITLRS